MMREGIGFLVYSLMDAMVEHLAATHLTRGGVVA